MPKRHKFLIGLALLTIPVLVLIVVPKQGSTSPEPAFSETQARYSTALDETVQCLQDQGFEAAATPNFTGLLHSISIHSDGANPDATEYEVMSRQDDAVDACSEQTGLQGSTDRLLEYLEPSNKDLGLIAVECASVLSLDIELDVESPESMLLDVFHDDAGRACAEESIGALMRDTAASLKAAEQG